MYLAQGRIRVENGWHVLSADLLWGGVIDFYWSLLKKGNKTKGRNSVALIKRGVTIIGDAHFVNY